MSKQLVKVASESAFLWAQDKRSMRVISAWQPRPCVAVKCASCGADCEVERVVKLTDTEAKKETTNKLV
ncbi:hypothetical protein PILCRDRAFT_814964 [Piloderma croceum F 1598]|uniref:Uncharacterized protein n=1 Tax=Piloderma croceum (strain F 1598) TaxID=765440 RepID=A0A0C3FT87_PILCF|nr:hypothetical protein PILCRDRAFT_814964 [Piloderma croceum F 1598]